MLCIGPQKPYNVTIMANVEPETSTLSVSLEWKIRETDGYSNTIEYFVTIWPQLLGISSFNTTATSLLLNLSYDQEYHIRMIASNCIGNSTPINISIGEYHNLICAALTLYAYEVNYQCRSMSYPSRGKYIF